MALYSGIVKVGADGTAEIAFDIPAFAGTVRVMAVAWSKDKVGHAIGRRHRARSGGADRDAAALPAARRPLLVHFDLDNVEGAAGDYTIAVNGTDALSSASRAAGACAPSSAWRSPSRSRPARQAPARSR